MKEEFFHTIAFGDSHKTVLQPQALFKKHFHKDMCQQLCPTSD
jgi:hypothetical protein